MYNKYTYIHTYFKHTYIHSESESIEHNTHARTYTQISDLQLNINAVRLNLSLKDTNTYTKISYLQLDINTVIPNLSLKKTHTHTNTNIVLTTQYKHSEAESESENRRMVHATSYLKTKAKVSVCIYTHV